MDESDYVRDFEDITRDLNDIIINQQAEIEGLEGVKSELELQRAELQHQTALLEEEVNGLTLVVNYQYTAIAVILIFSVVIALWKVLNKWFFGGV